MPNLQKTVIYLLANENLPRISPHLQVNVLTTGTLSGLIPLTSAFLVHKCTCPNPHLTGLYLAAICISQIIIPLLFPNKLNFWLLSLPYFASLFTLTNAWWSILFYSYLCLLSHPHLRLFWKKSTMSYHLIGDCFIGYIFKRHDVLERITKTFTTFKIQLIPEYH